MTKPPEIDGIYAVPAEPPGGGPSPTQMAALLALPVSVAVSVGRVRASIEQLLAAGPATILALDAKIDDPVELLVGELVIARGRLVDLAGDSSVGVEITEIVEDAARGGA